MTRKLYSSGSKYEEMAGYSRAVADGDWIMLSGTAGFNPDGSFPTDVTEQAENIFRTNGKTLKEAGASLDDVVQVRVFVGDRAYIGPVCAVLKKHFDKVRPTNTTMVVTLPAPEMLVEMEMTALRRKPAAKKAAAKKVVTKKKVAAKKKPARKKR
jgi:enamine deaminase RidA (YjgF/YER057c/UK114 family)